MKETKDWKELYASLRRKYGLREEFTEMIMLCRKCCALFWKSLGHPCFVLAEDAVFIEHGESKSQKKLNFVKLQHELISQNFVKLQHVLISQNFQKLIS